MQLGPNPGLVTIAVCFYLEYLSPPRKTQTHTVCVPALNGQPPEKCEVSYVRT